MILFKLCERKTSHLSNRAQSHKASWRLTPGLQGHYFVSDSTKKGAFNPEAQLCSGPRWLCSHRSNPPGSNGESPALPAARCCGTETRQDRGQHTISLLYLSKDTRIEQMLEHCSLPGGRDQVAEGALSVWLPTHFARTVPGSLPVCCRVSPPSCSFSSKSALSVGFTS